MNVYIKAQKSLRHSPKIMHIATILGISTKHAMGLVLNCWMFADDYADAENRVYGVTKSVLDKDAEIDGFCDALEAVGWLESGEGFLEFPFYLEKNDTTEKVRKDRKEKKREQAKERMRRMRERRKSEQENSHNNGVDESQECYAKGCVTGASQERNTGATSAQQPIGHYKNINNNTQERNVTTKTGISHSEANDSHLPEPSEKAKHFAAQWCFRLKRRKLGKPADNQRDVEHFFQNLLDIGIPEKVIDSDLMDLKRDAGEYLWQLKNRVLQHKPTEKSYAEICAEQNQREREQWERETAERKRQQQKEQSKTSIRDILGSNRFDQIGKAEVV